MIINIELLFLILIYISIAIFFIIDYIEYVNKENYINELYFTNKNIFFKDCILSFIIGVFWPLTILVVLILIIKNLIKKS